MTQSSRLIVTEMSSFIAKVQERLGNANVSTIHIPVFSEAWGNHFANPEILAKAKR
jgi:hypothetical protein